MGKFKIPEQQNYFQFRAYIPDIKKEEIVGNYYYDREVVDIEKNTTKRVLRKIIDVEYINRPHYIYDGWALLLDDDFWRFGCPLDGYIFSSVKIAGD